jgi:hypothetical protein
MHSLKPINAPFRSMHMRMYLDRFRDIDTLYVHDGSEMCMHATAEWNRNVCLHDYVYVFVEEVRFLGKRRES